MYMFVFENVLCDYTDGMALIAAPDLQTAQELAFERFGFHWQETTVEQFLDKETGFQQPTGRYPLTEGSLPGVLHHVYGGG